MIKITESKNDVFIQLEEGLLPLPYEIAIDITDPLIVVSKGNEYKSIIYAWDCEPGPELSRWLEGKIYSGKSYRGNLLTFHTTKETAALFKLFFC